MKDTVKSHLVPRKFLLQWCDDKKIFYPIKIINKNPLNFKILKKNRSWQFLLWKKSLCKYSW